MRQVIYFSAAWCAACQTVTPLIEQLSGVQVKKIDTDYDITLVEKYGVKSVPTIIVLENGQEIKRHTGGNLNANLLNSLIKG